MRKIIPILVITLAVNACARVPVEVKTAMEKQAIELQHIKIKYRESVDILFGQIRVLQLYILSEKEREFQQRYARGPQAVKLEDGTSVAIYTDPTGKPLPPSGNPDRDVIALSTNKIISDWFMKKRAETEENLLRTKEEFFKLDGHVEIAQQINAAVTEYLDSLVNLRRAQKELGNNLIRKIGAIPGASILQTNLIRLLIPNTQELQDMLTR